jgi:hypothetical protein
LFKNLNSEFENENNGTVIVVKAHRFTKGAESAILLIRNPYEAILSELNRKRGHGHTRLVFHFKKSFRFLGEPTLVSIITRRSFMR